MPRNKYPEQTVERILSVSAKLFMQKGYEKTTMQDILNELKLSKGAIYHHFKSKEEILAVVIEHLAQNELALMNELATHIQGANGKEKLQNLMMGYLSGAVDLYGTESKDFLRPQFQDRQSLASGEFLMANINSWMRDIAPIFAQVIEEGVADGSLKTDYPLETAEMVIMLFGLWTKPRTFDSGEQPTLQRLRALQDILKKLGVDIFTDAMIDKAIAGYRHLYLSEELENE